jgi:hypothetical protein
MDLSPDVSDVLDLSFTEEAQGWLRSDSSLNYDNSYSFSVVYRMNDFPFPSIQYPSARDDSIDTQFSSDCVFGSGSSFSCTDPFGDHFAGMYFISNLKIVRVDCAKISPRGRLPMLLLPDCKESDSLTTPVKLVDLRNQVEAASRDAGMCESTGNTEMSESFEGSSTDTNPVEFRSGYRGVSWNRRMKAWLAFWSEGKNRRSKTFNAKVMGFDKARDAAIDFLKRKKQLLQQADEHSSIDGFHAMEGHSGVDEEEFGDVGSLADSATTTSDSPNSSDVLCASCVSDKEVMLSSNGCNCSSGSVEAH